MNNEQKAWNYFKSKGFNDFGVAGLLGNLHAESAINPMNLQNSFEKRLGFSDIEYVEAVDNGSYGNFVHDSAGFGIAQWTFWSRKQGLLKHAKSRGVSIGDLDLQLDYLYKELCSGYRDLVNILHNANSVREASDAVLIQFERPADQSESMCIRREGYGKVYYDQYADKYSTEQDRSESVDEKDNNPDDWAEEAIEWAVKNEILFGDEHGNYKLHKECTRQEMLVFLNRLYKLVE